MMFDSALRELEEEQRREIAGLRRNYRRTMHVVSPRRMIRKHPLACASAAALLGVWLVPAPGPSGLQSDGKTGPGARGKRMIGRVVDSIFKRVDPIPKGVDGGQEHQDHKEGRERDEGAAKSQPLPELMTRFLEEATKVLGILRVLGQVVLERVGRSRASRWGEEGIDVADVGTISPESASATTPPFHFDATHDAGTGESSGD